MNIFISFYVYFYVFLVIIADETTPLINNVPKRRNQTFVQELFAVSNSDFVDSGLLRKIYTVIKVSLLVHKIRIYIKI